jgi:hypothetical protein
MRVIVDFFPDTGEPMLAQVPGDSAESIVLSDLYLCNKGKDEFEYCQFQVKRLRTIEEIRKHYENHTLFPFLKLQDNRA